MLRPASPTSAYCSYSRLRLWQYKVGRFRAKAPAVLLVMFCSIGRRGQSNSYISFIDASARVLLSSLSEFQEETKMRGAYAIPPWPQMCGAADGEGGHPVSSIVSGNEGGTKTE